jgi:hypothetical protein
MKPDGDVVGLIQVTPEGKIMTMRTIDQYVKMCREKTKCK